jgi:type I restriction enzyme S subunit
MKWSTPALGQIATITGGSTPSRTQAEYWNGSIPWLTPTDLPMPGKGIADVSDTAGKITEEGLAAISAPLLPVGTVLFSSRATIGKLGISRVPLATNQGFANFIPKKFVDAKYLAYCLLHYTAEITALAGSTTFKEVTKTALKKFKVPLPALSEQHRIVEILDQADALRKKCAEADAKAARILPALFYKMFGDPLANPRGFPTEEVGNLLTFLRNGTTTEQNQDNRGYPVTRIETISSGIINPDRVRYVELDDYELAKWRMETGDILFSHINSETHIGKTAIYKGQPDPLIHGMNLLLMRPDRRRVQPEYLFAVLNTDSVRAAYRQRCKRAVNQASLNQKDISALEIALPPVDAQDNFCRIAGNVLQQVSAQQKTTENIDHLFENLLHRAFNGDLTAKWREAHMKELLQEMEQQAEALNLKGLKA